MCQTVAARLRFFSATATEPCDLRPGISSNESRKTVARVAGSLLKASTIGRYNFSRAQAETIQLRIRYLVQRFYGWYKMYQPGSN